MAQADPVVVTRRVASYSHIENAHRNRRSTSLSEICGPEKDGPGVRDDCPSTGARGDLTKQDGECVQDPVGNFLNDPRLSSPAAQAGHQSAHGHHGDIEEPGICPGFFLRLPELPEPPFRPFAEIFGHSYYPKDDMEV
jgi:hypothetical protein